jgi:hypothetical protein
MISLIREQLNCFNDIKFDFDPKLHRYTYDDKPFISVTTYIQQFHKQFQKDYWSKRKSDESGFPQEFILAEWKRINDYANEVGTETHQWIENYFNKVWAPLPLNQDVLHRINKFNHIYVKQLYKLEPIKSEVMVFSKKWSIAGMIDALFLYRGKIYIVDYKTNKDFTTDDNCKYPEKLLPPFSDFNKTHLNEYSIQISLYSLILEEWGFNVAGGYILHIGPDDGEAKLYKCADMRETLRKYLDDNVV